MFDLLGVGALLYGGSVFLVGRTFPLGEKQLSRKSETGDSER